MASGSMHSMGYAKETTYGVPSTDTYKEIRHTGTSLALTKETLESEEIRSDRQITDVRHGARQVGGDIEIELSLDSFDDLLEAVLCGEWDPVDEVLRAGTTRRSFTIERWFSDLEPSAKPYHLFTGVEFNTLQLQVNANAMVTGTFGVVGHDMVVSDTPMGAPYQAPPTTPPLDSFTGVIKEAGTTIGVVTEVQLTIDNGLDPRFVVGSKVGLRPSIGRSNVSGQITAYFEDGNLLQKFIDETESSISFDLTDGSGDALRFTLPRIKYTGGQPDVAGEGPITLAIPFQALYDVTEDSNIVIERVSA